jgi:hypothetical protein
VSVTVVPTAPEVGAKLVRVGTGGGGADVMVKLPEELAVPPGVVTEIAPEAAPLGTVAVICVALITVKDVAGVPAKLTAVAPVKPVPVSVTVVPTAPEVGEKLVRVTGGGGAGGPAGDEPPPPQALNRPRHMVRKKHHSARHGATPMLELVVISVLSGRPGIENGTGE